MSFTRPLSRGLLAVVAALSAVVVAVVVVGVVLIAGHTSKGSVAASHEKVISKSGSTPAKPLPPVSMRIAHLKHGTLPFAKPLHVQVTNGALSSVKVVQAGDGVILGAFNKTRTRWHSAAPLPPSSQLHATIKYADLAHHTTKRSVKITTPTVTSHFSDEVSPSGGATVGVAEPISVSFDQDIPTSRRAAVERGLTVTATPAVVGAWHWMSDDVVNYRPPSYWKPGTKITVTSDLQGADLGHGVWGEVGKHQATFKIGASHVSEVDQATETMKVYDNGKLIKTFPDSTGRGQYPTMDGIHIVLSKQSVIEMNSATVGIPKGNPDYYDETVYWDARISNGGEFVHAAPWSVGSQGHVNVSHGCVNLSTENAEWFYNWAQNGDVVDIFNGVRAPELGDAGTADWNMSWKAWLKGDADPSPAAVALTPRTPRDYEPNFTPHDKAAAKRAAKKAAKHHGGKHHGATKSGSSSSSSSPSW
jgi:lipoprotein-anchoring transpeptidase ErfK/SrfK